MDEPTFITFVRHGQSLSNKALRWEGNGDSPLSELGQQQAALLAKRLAREHFTHVVVSDLSRAVETVRATGLAFDMRPALREMNWGVWEGLTNEELSARYPAELERLRNGEDIPRGGAETEAVFTARVNGALRTLRAELAPGDHALVVCHGGFISIALASLLGLSTAPLPWTLARATNVSITTVSYDATGTRLHRFNDALHLLPLGDWPGHSEASAVVGLVCDTHADDCFGAFAGRFDASEALRALGPGALPAAQAQLLGARVGELHQLHTSRRVALAAQGAAIQAWAHSHLWATPRAEAAMAAPLTGSISHVARIRQHLVLLDYGVAALTTG